MRLALFLHLGALLFLGASLGCGGVMPADPTTHEPAQTSSAGADSADSASTHSSGTEQSPEATDARALAAGAHFADVVAALEAAEVAHAEAATAPCVMTGGSDDRSAHVDAEVAAAVHPIPDAPADLASRVGVEAVAILSRFGARGPAQPGLAVATLTSTDPPGDGEQMLIVLTSRGALLRSTDRAMDPGTPFSLEELRRRLNALSPAPELLALTAEASIPVSVLHDALLAVPDALAPRLALAVTLPPGTRTPEAAAASAQHSPICEDLPALAVGEREGVLEGRVLLAGVAPLRDAVPACLDTAGADARAGTMVLRFRVARDGSVAAACVASDETGSDGLRTCVLEHLGQLHFPAPSPAGVVEAAIPLRFALDHGAPLHGQCLAN
ncbi:MAG: hypothetical protein GW913_12120 [Myxococcales bacterium]|nr:hypothetical protein [Myxococcales bacterium]